MSDRRCNILYYTEENGLPVISVHNHTFTKYPSHRHDFFEMEYVLDGEIDCILNGKQVHLKKGKLVFVTPSSVHEYSSAENTSVTTITVHFNMEAVRLFPKLLLLQDGVINCTEELTNAFYMINAENRKKDDLRDIALKNAFERVIILFLRTAQHLELNSPGNGIFPALSYINTNFSEDISLEKISKKCGYSSSYLCRIFKQETQLTPMQYLNKIRLESACRLLVSTGMSAIEICGECGFGSVRNFNREFKKKYGVTPIEYRKTEAKIRP